MGQAARDRIWAAPDLKVLPSTRLLLLALAEFIPDDGYTCWPSLQTLGRMVGVTDRQVMRLVDQAEAAGLIVCRPGRGRTHSNLYGLLVGLPADVSARVRRDVKGDMAMSPIPEEKVTFKGDIAVSSFETEKVTSDAEKVTSAAGKGDIAVSHEPKVEPKVEPNEDDAQQLTLLHGHPPADDPGTVDGKGRPRNPNQQHPAVLVFYELTKRRPNDVQADLIAGTVEDLDRWRATVQHWLGAGWAKTNAADMVRRYQRRDDRVQETDRHDRQAPSRPAAPRRPASAAIAAAVEPGRPSTAARIAANAAAAEAEYLARGGHD